MRILFILFMLFSVNSINSQSFLLTPHINPINGDNWNDCGSDGDCDQEDADETQENGAWDEGEGTEIWRFHK